MGKVELQAKGRGVIRSYVFRVVVEPDEDRWFVNGGVKVYQWGGEIVYHPS